MESLVNIVTREFRVKAKVSKYPNGVFCIYSEGNESIHLEIFIKPRSSKELMGSYIKVCYSTNIRSKYFDEVEISPDIVQVGLKNKGVKDSEYKQVYNLMLCRIRDCYEKVIKSAGKGVRLFEVALYVDYRYKYTPHNCYITVIVDFIDNLSRNKLAKVFESCVSAVKDLEDLAAGKIVQLDSLLVSV